MARFQVTFVDAAGALSTRELQADTRQAVAASLGVPISRVLTIHAVDAADPMALRSRVALHSRFPLRLFSQELAVLLDAGIPLLEALVTLREKEGAAGVARAMDGVIAALREGQSLSAGLRAAPQAFSALFIATVEASERTGQLGVALRQHAAYLAWTQTLRDKLMAAAIYPAMLLLAGGAVLLFLLLFVVPRFAGLLEGFQGELPWASRALMHAGQAAASQPGLAVATALAPLVALVLAVRRPQVRDALLRWIWRWPVVGARLRLLELAKLYRGAALLLAAGVPLVASLRTCVPLVNTGLRSALERCTATVQDGERLSTSLASHGLATPVALRMVRVGERSGELGAMLERAAAFHDEELARIAELVTRVLNPVLMLVMGVVIGAVVLLLYLPIFQLAEQVQ